VKRLLEILTSGFPVWVLGASIVALVKPATFTWFSGPAIPVGLAIIMLGMGLTLAVEDFERVARRPVPALCGVLLQYTVMPLLGWSLGYALGLPNQWAVGLVLVACCPGGTASNVICYLANADVALSVSMTSVSTLLAALMTPTLTALLAGSRVNVPAWGLFLSTVQVIVLPVIGGLLLRRYLPGVTRRILPGAPLAAVVMICLIVASVIGAGKEQILRAAAPLLAGVMLLHASGFLLGYVLSRLWLRNENLARTISVEVGMQNSGLGVVLARQNFPNPAVAIPSAISSLTHSLIGSLLAAIWRKWPANDPAPEGR
jgi:bile acid:Na+ symporter, BASS family